MAIWVPNEKPTGNFGLDYSNPHTDGLSMFMPLNGDRKILHGKGEANNYQTQNEAYTDAEGGAALDCDGSTYLSVSGLTLLGDQVNTGSDYSCAIEFKTLMVGSGYIYTENRWDAALRFHTYISSGVITHRIRDGGWTYNFTLTTGTTTFNDGKWHVVEITYDRSAKKHSLYVDGHLYGSFTETSTGQITDVSNITLGRERYNISANSFDGQIKNLAHWIGKLRTDEEAYDYGVNPGQILESRNLGFWLPTGGGAGAELAGDATGQATAAAEATTGIPIAGAMLSVATSNGAISTGINIGGAASAISLLDGNIDTEIRVSVAAIIEALAQAGLDTQTLFEAAAAGQADAGGTLSGTGADLSGAANALADANATITVAITMQGDALAEALAQAGLTAPGSGLAGDASAVADAVAVLLTQINMIGGGSAVVTALGGIDTILQMQGAAAAASNALGGLTAQVQFNAQALIQALAQAGLTTADGGLEGDAGAVADASAWLKIKVQFDGAAVGVAVAAGNFTAGAIDIPTIPRWEVVSQTRNFKLDYKRQWRISA